MPTKKQEEISQSPESAVVLSPTGALVGQLERLISEVNYLNTYLTQSVSRFGEHIQNHGDRLTNLENRLRLVEGQNSGHESENSIPETEVQETKSEASDAGDMIGVVPEIDSLLYSSRREEEEDQSVVTRNLLAELSPELTNVLSVANCVTVFRLASLYELKNLSDAAQDVICKNLKEVLKVFDGKVSVASAASPALGSGSEEQGELPVSPVLAGSPRSGHALQGKPDQLISEVNQLNSYMGTVTCSVMDFQSREKSLQDRNGRLEGHENRLEIQNRTLEKEFKSVEDQNKGLEDLSRKLEEHYKGLGEQIKGLKSELQQLKTRNPGSVKEKTGYVLEPSLPRSYGRDVLFVMGGEYDGNTIETLDPAVGHWVPHKIPDAPSREIWIGCMGHRVLVLERVNRKFRYLDIPTREWTQLRFMPQHRDYYTVTSSGDQVYVLGGVEPHATRCDRYNARTDHWDEMAPMREGRRLAASVYHSGKLYCSAGLSVPEDCPLSSLEVLDPQKNGHWATLPPMGVARYLHCLVSCGRFLWAIGGHDGNTILSDVERFDVEGQQWNRVRPLNTPRWNFSASIVGGRVHVIGGWTTGSLFDPTVEVYDDEKDLWVSATSLQKGRFSHGSCLVCSLPDADAEKFAVSVK